MLWDPVSRVESKIALSFFCTPKEGEQCNSAAAEVASGRKHGAVSDTRFLSLLNKNVFAGE